ncbi:protein kinase domain-containing protein, partial [Actinomadura rubrisoli]
MSGETSHPEHIGPYRLLSRLGGGDAGACPVHRATGPDGRDVAIRLLPPGAEPDLARMREVLSPYVVDVLDGEPGTRRPYIVSRFVPGRPLAEHVAEQGPVGGDVLRRMALGLAKALAALHGAGLAHGDLGPGTVLVVDGAPVVVDFGLTAGAHVPGDVRAWAATVTFAATGRSDAPSGALPAELRPLVEAAAHPDPAARPSAAELAEAASGLV